MDRKNVFKRLSKEEFILEMMKPVVNSTFNGKRIVVWGENEKISPKKTIRW